MKNKDISNKQHKN